MSFSLPRALYLLTLLVCSTAIQAQQFRYISSIPKVPGNSLENTSCVAINNEGIVFIGETESGLVRGFDSTGVQVSNYSTLITSKGQVTLKKPRCIDFNNNNDFVVYDEELKVLVVKKASGECFSVGDPGTDVGQLGDVVSVAINDIGYIYTLNATTDHVDIYSPDGVFLTWIAGASEPFDHPVAIGINGANEVYVLCEDGPTVYIFNQYGNVVNINRGLSRKLGIAVKDAAGLAVCRNGEFYLFDKDNCQVAGFSRIGDSFGTLGSKGTWSKGMFEEIGAIAAGSNGDLAILDVKKNMAQSYYYESRTPALTTNERPLQLFLEATEKHIYAAVAVNSKGIRFFVPFDKHTDLIAEDEKTGKTIFHMVDRFKDAVALAIDASGSVLVVDRKMGEVVLVDETGLVVRRLGKEIPNKLKEPTSVAVQSTGNIVVADYGRGSIHIWNKNGIYQKEVATRENSILRAPKVVAVDSRDQIFIWDEDQNAVLRAGSWGWPLLEKQLKARGSAPGAKEGTIAGMCIDPLDEIHIFNKSNYQIEVYYWDVEPALRFSSGRKGEGLNSFSNVDLMLYDKHSFTLHFPMSGGKQQRSYRLMVKPPKPVNMPSFDVSEGQLVLGFTPFSSRSQIGYGVLGYTTTEQDTLFASAFSTNVVLDESSINSSDLFFYRPVSISATGYSDPAEGFFNYYGQAQRMLRKNQYEAAIEVINEVLVNQGKSPSMVAALSKQCRETGRKLVTEDEVIKGMQYLKLAFSLTPDDKQVRNDYTYGYSRYFAQMSDNNDLKSIMEEAQRQVASVSMKPIVLAALDSLSLSLSSVPNEMSVQNAIQLQKKIMEWDPSNVSYYSSLAFSQYDWYSLKKFKGVPPAELKVVLNEAISAAERAIATLKSQGKPVHEIQLRYLALLNDAERYTEVEVVALNVLNASQTSLDARYMLEYNKVLASAYAGLRKYDAAVLQYQRLLAQDENNKEIMLLLADAQLQAGKTDDAKRGYQKLLQIDRDNVQIIGRLGKLELAIGNFGEASFQLEKAVKLNPSDKSLYGPLARAYRGAGNSNRAVANLLVAVPYEYQLWQQSQNSLKPKVEQDELRAQYFADLGALAQLQYESGDNEQSVETCQRWVEQDPTNAEAHYSLGRACIAAGLVFDGEKALAEAVKLDPKREAYSATLQDAQKLKDQAKVSAHEITIAEFKLNDLYPSLYRNYADAKSLPIGELVIANNGSVAIVGASLTVFQSQLMSEPTSVKCPTLLPFSNNRIKLNAIFTDKILDFTTDTKLQMVAEVQYKDGKGTAKLTKAAPLTVHGRNAISWSDKRRLAAFVEPNAEYLIRFVQAVDQVYQSEPTNGLNKRLLHAAQIYTLLRQLQWSYRPDPLQSFATVSTQTEIMDYLQFPAETMQRKSGDCDDLVTAMAAMLEAAGIPTAYIDVPGHVFLAFDTGIKPSEMSANGIGPVDAIVNDDKVWIPLETTLVGSQPFVVAWKSAGERYYAEVKAGHFPEVVSLSDARQLYLPATFIPNDYQMQLPNYAEVEKAYGEVMMQLIAKTRKQAIAELEARYIAEPNNVFVKNKYATLLAQIGDLDRAERILLEALALSPGSASVLNNLGNVYLLKKEGSKAVDYYTQASGQDVADAEIIINLCKANLLAGNLTKARELFDKAVELNNNIANRYEHLKLQLK